MRKHLRGVLNELCNSLDLLYALAVIEVVLLFVSAIGTAYFEPGTPGHVVWLLNTAGLVVLLSISGTIVVMCFRR